MVRHLARAHTLALMALATASAPAAVADTPDASRRQPAAASVESSSPASPSWAARLFGASRKPVARASSGEVIGRAPNGRPIYAPAPADKADARPDAPSAGDAPKVTTPAEVAKTVQARQAELLRRMEAVSRIREIALLNNDDAMLQKADRLERDAMEMYTSRTAHLPLPDAKADDRPATASAGGAK